MKNVFSAPLRWFMPPAPPGLPRILSEIDLTLKARPPLADVLRAMDQARDPLCHAFHEGLGTSIASQALTLKVLNLLLAKYHFGERSTTLLSRPFGLVVDPANGCNLACPGCVHSAGSREFKLFDWDKGLLTEDRFLALLQRYGTYALHIMFCNYGEPTANLNTPKFIQLAKAYMIQTALSTNLTIPRFDAEAYVRSGLDWMFLSIDGATQSVYEQFRRNGRIDIAFENVRKLVEAKKRLGKDTPILRWQYLAFEHNAHEIATALEMARAMGVDQFHVFKPFDVSWDVPSIQPAKGVRPVVNELRPGMEDALRRNWDFNDPGDAAKIIEREFAAKSADRAVPPSGASNRESGHTCSWLYKALVMDANGRILPCCAAPRPDAHLVFAKFPDRENDCFNSPDHQGARRHFTDGADAPPEGSIAPYCNKCEWDQTHTEVDHPQVASYFRTVGRGLVNPATVRILSDW
jgi:MoaA/NifB/PqqE/SkfB family radical SAM enzyme